MTLAAFRLLPVTMLSKPGAYPRASTVGEVLVQLSRAETVGDQLVALARLSEVADKGALPAIRRALSSDDVRVREAAVEALKPIVDRTVPVLLETIILHDPSPRVRCAAIFVSMFRYAPYVKSALKVAAADANEDVRIAASVLLGMP